ncbi:MAG: sulfite exporter TauE/SafE family protein [Pseudomonadota bacterium]
MFETTLLGVFLAGLLGGVHCAGMCGGIVGALAMVRPDTSLRGVRVVGLNTDSSAIAAPRTIDQSPVLQNALYNLGRLISYTSLGLVAGSVGSVTMWFDTAYPLQQMAFALSNSVLIFIGCYVAGMRWPVRAIERVGAPVWQRVRPFAIQRLALPGAANRVVTGALWGLVPCGMVYAVLVAALASGSVLSGGLLMLAFGLGTLPNLMLLGLSASWLQRARRVPQLRLATGALLCGFGLLGLMRLDVAQQVPFIRALCAGLPL